MKNFILLFTFTLLLNVVVYSQSCLPEGIIFNTQAQIDNFQINYPNCTEIEGNVTIGQTFYPSSNSTNIKDLTGLNVINSIGGDFIIYNNDSLLSLNGLENLSYIGGDFSTGIYYQGPMVPGFKGSQNLVNIEALSNLTSIGGDLRVWNTGLYDLSGLENLLSVQGDISLGTYWEFPGQGNGGKNLYLDNIDGIENITTVGEKLRIEFNDSLTDITSLNENITVDTMIIRYNYLLSECAVKTVCNHFSSGNNYSIIMFNALGCNTQVEIEEECDNLGVAESRHSELFSIYPNPATEQFFIISNNGLKVESLNIYNQLGQTVFQVTEVHETIDISKLSQGVYIIELISKHSQFRQKLIIEE